MKYWIIGLMVVAIVSASYWASTRQKNRDGSNPTETPTEEISAKMTILPSQTAQVLSVGNKSGNQAPDFRLKDIKGDSVSLRDFQNREDVTLEFTIAGRLILRSASFSQGVVLLDPDSTVYRLYGSTTMPYTVNIDKNGIIR